MNQKMEYFLQYIATAKEKEIERIIEAVIHRCDAAAPEVENVFLSIPKGSRERQKEYMEDVCNFLWNRELRSVDKR